MLLKWEERKGNGVDVASRGDRRVQEGQEESAGGRGLGSFALLEPSVSEPS